MMEADLAYVQRESSVRIHNTSLSPESYVPRVNTTLSVHLQDDQRVGGAPRRTAPVEGTEHLRLRKLAAAVLDVFHPSSRKS